MICPKQHLVKYQMQQKLEILTNLNYFSIDEVKRPVEGLPVTTENQGKGLQVLNERYSNIEIKVNNHFEELTTFRGVYNNDDTTNRREQFD